MQHSEPAQQPPVIVVGAGPVGLTAALALRANGLPARVLEAEPEDRVRPGSRAIYIHGATLKILEKLRPGLGRRLADAGVVWPTRRTTFRGRDVFVRSYPLPPPTQLPHFTSLPQVHIERMLLEACRECGVQIDWGAAVERVAPDASGVTLATADGRQWRAAYAIAADGARSSVRRLLGIDMQGSRSENSFVIVDLAEVPDSPLPLERVFHYEHPAMDGRNVLLVPFAGGWRADLECREGEDPEQFAQGEGARRWIAAVMGDRYADRITWVSTYRFLQVLAASFTDPQARVLLVGEAAHLFAPFGARGMNSGVPDAQAAAGAIARALAATDAAAARAAIETFARDRRAAAEWNRQCAGAALEHLQAKGAWLRLKRRLAAMAAPISEKAGEWLDTAPYGPRIPPPTGTKY